MFLQVLVPLDGSDVAERALPYLRDVLSEGCATQAILLNVVTVPTPWDATASVSVYNDSEILLAQSANYLERLRAGLESEGLRVKAQVLEGSAATTILEYARTTGTDLILMATHGYSGIKRLVLGSVAQQIVQESPCPVLLIGPKPTSENRR